MKYQFLLAMVFAIIFMAPAAFSAMTMHGYVLKSVPADEKWIANAIVRCSSSSNDYTATSGADGYYSIQGMEPGKYTCSVSASGYFSAIREVSIGCNGGCECNTCDCSPCDQSVKRVDFFLKPMQEMAKIYGHVFEDGNGVSATVRCGDFSANSDSSGYYEMALPAGTYYCTADGYNGKSIMLYGGEERVVNFFIPKETPTTIEYPENGRLYGYTYANGRRVQMYISCGQYSAASNSMGYYSIYLPEGTYTCTAKYLSHYTTFTVSVSGSTRKDVHISYPETRKYRIYGYVYAGGRRLDNVRVWCDGDITYSSNGYYEMLLDEGSYTCRFSKPGFLEKTVYVSLHSDRRVDVTLQAVERRFRLYGSAYPRLTLECDGPERKSITAYGAYSISLKEGNYWCRAYAPGYRSLEFSISLNTDRRKDIRLEKECRFVFTASGRMEGDAKAVVTVKDSSTCKATYRISYSSDCRNVRIYPPYMSLQGTSGTFQIYADSDRKCTARVKISSQGGEKLFSFTFNFDKTPPEITARQVSCNDGLEIAATDDSGWARIRVYREGKLVRECVNSCMVEENLPGGSHSYRIVAEDRSGNRKEKLVRIYVCRKGILEGRVSGKDGSPIPNAIIKCDGRAVESDMGGRFSLSLEEGYYVCSAIADGYKRSAFDATVRGRTYVKVVLEGEEKGSVGTTVKRVAEAYSARKTVVEGKEVEKHAEAPWYYARAVLWWIALILAISLLIFIIIVILSSRE